MSDLSGGMTSPSTAVVGWRRSSGGFYVSRTVLLLWVVALVEIVSPIPGLLSLGAVYVLLVRPGWFPAIVRELYGDRDGG